MLRSMYRRKPDRIVDLEKGSQSSETAATSVSVASVSPVISAAARPENYVANTVEQFGTDMISAISETGNGLHLYFLLLLAFFLHYL